MTYSNPSDFASRTGLPEEDTCTDLRAKEELCGESKSCAVYRQRIGGILQAVKVLCDEYTTNPVYVSAVRKEYRIGRGLKHDAIPVYRDFTDNEKEVSIVMDYVDGISLDKFVVTDSGKEYFGNAENAGKFFRSLLDVLNYLHRRGVVHCDLKPSNIMLRYSDRGVMLIDYDKAYCDIFDRTHGGTAGMSEPLAEGEKPTSAKDLAAFGEIVRYIAANVPGFPSRKFRRLIRAVNASGVSSRSLEEALKARSNNKYTLIACGIVVLLGIGISGYYTVGSQANNVEVENRLSELPMVDERPAAETEHSIQTESDSPAGPEIETVSAPVSTVKVGSGDGKEIDYAALARMYDEKMADVNREVDKVEATLKSGKYTDEEFSEMQMRIMKSYTDRYTSFVDDYRAQTPGLSEYDVMPVMARMMDLSKFQPKFKNLMDMFSEISQKRIDALIKNMSEHQD